MRPNLLPASVALALLTWAPGVVAAQESESSGYIHVLDQGDRGQVVLLIGPVDLPAGASHGAHSPGGGVPLQVARFPRAGWIHGFVADMVDAAGTPLQESFLHHVKVIDPDHRELFSPISRRIIAAGPETGKKELPESMGLPMEAGQRLLVRAVFHNPTEVAREDLYLRIRFSFTPSQAGEARAGIFPVYLDVKPPVGSKAFDLPPGRSSQSWEARPAVSGRLLAAAGHMHQYAASLRLEDATDGKVLWEVVPVTDSERRIESVPMGSFWKKGGLPLRSDDVYRLTVTYDNPTGAVIPDGGMGTLGGVFIPEPGELWPEVDKEHPDYLADLAHTRGVDLARRGTEPEPAPSGAHEEVVGDDPHAGHPPR